MEITIDVKAALICLLLIALIVFVVYLIILAKNLVKTINQTNKILEDSSVISGVAAEKTVQIGEIVDDVKSVVVDLAQAVKGEQKPIAALSNIVKAVGNLAAIFQQKDCEAESAKSKKKGK